MQEIPVFPHFSFVCLQDTYHPKMCGFLSLWRFLLSSVCPRIPFVYATAKSLQSCPTLCDPSTAATRLPIPGILQARTLEWVAISFSNAWKWKVKVKSLSCVQLSATPWTAAYQSPLSMRFSRQEYWSGLPLPSLRSSWGVQLQNENVSSSECHRAQSPMGPRGIVTWDPDDVLSGVWLHASQAGFPRCI